MFHEEALPGDDHHAAWKCLLVVCLCGHVSEADGGHAGHGEVERRQVLGRGGRASVDDGLVDEADVGPAVDLLDGHDERDTWKAQ